MVFPEERDLEKSIKQAQTAMFISLIVGVVLVIIFLYYANIRNQYDDIMANQSQDDETIESLLKSSYLTTTGYVSIALMVILGLYMAFWVPKKTSGSYGDIQVIANCVCAAILLYLAVRIGLSLEPLKPSRAQANPTVGYETIGNIEDRLTLAAFLALGMAGIMRFTTLQLTMLQDSKDTSSSISESSDTGKTKGGFVNFSSLDFIRAGSTKPDISSQDVNKLPSV
jgi:nitrogen fixation-related uncharacterized protein